MRRPNVSVYCSSRAMQSSRTSRACRRPQRRRRRSWIVVPESSSRCTRETRFVGVSGTSSPISPCRAPIPGSAIAAASTDPRFAPVTTEELMELQIELSILGPLERIAGVGDFEVGRHGLLVERGWNRGLLLPAGCSRVGVGCRSLPLADLSQGRPAARCVEIRRHDLAVRGGSLQRALIRLRSVFRFLMR